MCNSCALNARDEKITLRIFRWVIHVTDKKLERNLKVLLFAKTLEE